jgi:hypothetical protein
MSLSKLLAAGKSIMGVKDGNSPYRMNARNLLPKFISPKNPFATPKAVPARVPAAELETVSLFDHAAKSAPAAATPVPAPAPVMAPAVVETGSVATAKADIAVVEKITPAIPAAAAPAPVVPAPVVPAPAGSQRRRWRLSPINHRPWASGRAR